MSRKHQKKIYHTNLNVILKAANVTRIKIGRPINIGVSEKIPKNIMRAKRIIFGILIHVVVKMENIWQVLYGSMIMCD